MRVRGDWFYRRLHKSGASPESGADQPGEIGAADCSQHRDRCDADCHADLWDVFDQADCAVPQAISSRPGGAEPGTLSASLAVGVLAFYRICGPGHCGLEQRGQSYGRPGRPGHWMHGHCGGRADGADICEWARDVCDVPGNSAHAAGRGADDFLRSDGGIVDWISMVQRASRGSFHGGRGVAGAGRCDWDGGRDHQAGIAAAVYWRGVRDRGGLGNPAGGIV